METNRKNLPKHFDKNNVMKGNQGEEIVAALLRDRGYFVTCLSDINERGRGGAPGMRNGNEFLTLPDLQVALNGKIGYCEVKWKKEATWTRKTSRLEHGIDNSNWDHYRRIMNTTGVDTYLFIYERKTGEILYNKIDFLDGVVRVVSQDIAKYSKGGMCYFPKLSFHVWGYVVPVDGDLYIQSDIFGPKHSGSGGHLFAYDIPVLTLKP